MRRVGTLGVHVQPPPTFVAGYTQTALDTNGTQTAL